MPFLRGKEGRGEEQMEELGVHVLFHREARVATFGWHCRRRPKARLWCAALGSLLSGWPESGLEDLC